MDLTLSSLMQWTKLTVRNPRLASELVKEAKLPLEFSMLMIVLAGVVSGMTIGFLFYAIAPILAEIEEVTGQPTDLGPGPLVRGVLSSIQGVALAFALHRIGIALGGKGSFADICAVTAVVQMVVAALGVVVILCFFVSMVLGALLALFILLVSIRAFFHAVNVGHEFEDVGKPILVMILSFVVAAVVVSILATLLGLGGQGVPAGEVL